MFGFGRDKDPTQVHKDTLGQCIEKGYMCGEALDVPPYNLREAHRCNDPVEPIYYTTQDELLQRMYVLCAMDLTTWC